MRTIFTRLAAVAILLLAMELSHAQDIHFSQYYTSPLTLNPALTANINGMFRASFNYRNQCLVISGQPGLLIRNGICRLCHLLK